MSFYNIIIYPGINLSDAVYYEEKFNKNCDKDKFTASNIIYRKFGEITYRVMNNGKVMAPNVGKTNVIPSNVTKIINEATENISKNI